MVQESDMRCLMVDCLFFLVVDDSLGERILLRAQLQNLNHKVDMACDANSGLELALMRRYDVILIDTNLTQGFNCQELIVRIQKDSNLNQATPIVIMTHHNDMKGTQEEMRCVKPFTRQDTLKLIDSVTRLKRTK
ncbi:response regulator [Fluoribacter dumoffii]|uniref:Response regulator receiver n=2 Tax=Legionellaceae TaxID=444 RepID=A0A0W0SD87_9GAMM|nr:MULTISPECIES: response regulator [Legionellaceae]KTC81097.1 Response regulator receiver [Legionella cherrii]KTC91297.1 Response regulator receiver [Fluoribacter dumoffii NY 23]MCW8416919.1 response regulator [Fluoribacter dumoffii]MCW8455241.1 response regulator [Fluoribacter dumoffii]MCW8460682.1 response regulator [Fluoribacter dumoffii]